MFRKQVGATALRVRTAVIRQMSDKEMMTVEEILLFLYENGFEVRFDDLDEEDKKKRNWPLVGNAKVVSLFPGRDESEEFQILKKAIDYMKHIVPSHIKDWNNRTKDK